MLERSIPLKRQRHDSEATSTKRQRRDESTLVGDVSAAQPLHADASANARRQKAATAAQANT